MIDSHCHLNFDNLSKDFSSIIKRAKENNITAILSINTNPDEFESHYQLIEKHQSLFISYGLHPANVNSFNIPSINSLKFYCEYEQVIGIGETGLDFYRSTEHKSEQYQSFENHIECSYETNLPLIIHQRSSEKEIIDVLNIFNRAPCKEHENKFLNTNHLFEEHSINIDYRMISELIYNNNNNEIKNLYYILKNLI